MNVEKTIEFLLETQARHDAQIAKLIETQSKLTDAQAKNEGLMASVLEGIGGIKDSIRDMKDSIWDMKESILGLARIAQAHENRISGLEGEA